MNAGAVCFERLHCLLGPLPSIRQVKTDFSTTAISLGYVRRKACLVRSHMRKLLISETTIYLNRKIPEFSSWS